VEFGCLFFGLAALAVVGVEALVECGLFFRGLVLSVASVELLEKLRAGLVGILGIGLNVASVKLLEELGASLVGVLVLALNIARVDPAWWEIHAVLGQQLLVPRGIEIVVLNATTFDG
jgi:hypothetical protein